jgi:Uma2 family endonuclease
MPQTLTHLEYTHEPAPNAIRWTRKQCRAMLESGILTGRYELIEGEIINKMGQGPRHAYVITRLIAWLFVLFGPDYVRFQLPILVPGPDRETSEPEPDAAVLDHPAMHFVDATPDAAHVRLVIEVSDTTLSFDRNTKAALYARASIPEYWIVDIEGRQIRVHRRPAPGGYAAVTDYSAEEVVSCLDRPDAPVPVIDLLPPA